MAALYGPLDGDPAAARERLRNLAAAACQVLDAESLNTVCFHLAVYMDNKAGAVIFTERMMQEIEAERRRWPGSLQ
jgi:hypothetical protein